MKGAQKMTRQRKKYCPFGRLMAQRMYVLDLTTKSLAERIGTTQPHIVWIMHGKVLPLPKTVEKIADALGLDYREAKEAASKGF